MTETVIYRERSRTACAYPPEESFWNVQVDEMLRLVREHREDLERFQRESPGLRDAADDYAGEERGRRSSCRIRGAKGRAPGLVLTILGGRGSGKSSLLQTFVDRLREVDVHVLPQIDPTLLSEHDNFLHAFVALILEDLEERAAQTRQALHELTCRAALQKLADHLWVVNGGPPREEDPVAAGLERIDRHRSGPMLRRHLKIFLDRVAADFAMMRTRRGQGTGPGMIMVLPVDDPDMAFDHFTPTLEIYRRYLRHPNLVPVFAFSKELALELLTLQFGHHFGYEKKRIAEEVEFRQQVETLAYQFLDKYLPPYSRIVLELPQTQVLSAVVRSRLADGESRSRSAHNQPNGAEKRVSEILERACRLLFGTAELKESVLPASLRRILQLLDNLHPLDADSGTEKVTQKFLVTARSFLQVHSAMLSQRGVDPQRIYGAVVAERGSLLLRQVLEAAEKHGLPRWAEKDLDSLLLSLLAVLAFCPVAELEPESGSEAEQRSGTSPDEPSPVVLGSASQAGHWLLRLLLGFYLPLRLFRIGTETDVSKSPSTVKGAHVTRDRSKSVATVKDVTKDPHQLLIALDSGGASFPGTLAVHPGGTLAVSNEAGEGPHAYADPLYENAWRGYSCWSWIEVCGDNLAHNSELRSLERFPGLAGLLAMLAPEKRLVVLSWCIYGTAPHPWAMISLWRGLAFLLRLLEDPSDLAAATELHIRNAAIDDEIAAPPPAAVGVGRLDFWDEEASIAVHGLAEEVGRWLKKSSLGERDFRELVAQLHGPMIERQLFSPLAGLEGRLPFYRWGGGAALGRWLETMVEYADKLGWGDFLSRCPLIRPFLEKTADGWILEVEDENVVPGSESRTSPSRQRIPLIHNLTPVQILNLLVPADCSRYFARFYDALGRTNLAISQLL